MGIGLAASTHPANRRRLGRWRIDITDVIIRSRYSFSNGVLPLGPTA